MAASGDDLSWSTMIFPFQNFTRLFILWARQVFTVHSSEPLLAYSLNVGSSAVNRGNVGVGDRVSHYWWFTQLKFMFLNTLSITKAKNLGSFPISHFFSERIHSSSVCSVFDKVLRKSIMESVHSLFLSIASRGFSMVNVHYSIRVLTWLL